MAVYVPAASGIATVWSLVGPSMAAMRLPSPSNTCNLRSRPDGVFGAAAIAYVPAETVNENASSSFILSITPQP
jgi:hypothetical protein